MSNDIQVVTTGKHALTGYFIIFSIGDRRYQYDIDFSVLERAKFIAEKSQGKALSFVRKNNYRWERLEA